MGRVQGAVVALAVLASACGGGGSLLCPVNGPAPSPEARGLGIAGEEARFAFREGPSWEGCDPGAVTATVEVLDPAGAPLAGPASAEVAVEPVLVRPGASLRSASALARFTPTRAGEWTVKVTWSTGGVQTARFPVAARAATAGPTVRRTYVDRLDACHHGGPFVTSSGLVVCARSDDRIWVYDAAGNILESFPGRAPVVQGSHLWSGVNASVEHRTDVGGALRYDGAVTAPFGAAGSVPGKGQYAREADGGVLLMEWSGSTLTSQFVAGPVPWGALIVVPEGGKAWNERGCYARPGCQQTDCGNVDVCPTGENVGDATVLHDDAAFGQYAFGSGDLLQWDFVMRPRPFGLGAPLVHRSVRLADSAVPNGSWTSRSPTTREAFFVGDAFVWPVRDGDGLGFVAHPRVGELAYTLTDDWLIDVIDPFTAELTPLLPR